MVSLSLVQPMDQKNGSNPRELEQLLARIAAGEQEALAQLYSRTRGAVYALALSYLKNPHDAQDTAQDTYVQVWENAEKYRPQGSPMAWLLTIARNLARLRLRQAGRQESLEHQEWEAIPAGEEGVSPEDRHLLQAPAPGDCRPAGASPAHRPVQIPPCPEKAEKADGRR